MMTCLICRQADLENGFASIPFERGEMKFTVHHVPAQICPHCSEVYVYEEAGNRLLQIAEELAVAGMIEDSCEYDGDY
jgi:YgiT-type zinc finger domain-containing protein